jgi:hypothetical protein
MTRRWDFLATKWSPSLPQWVFGESMTKFAVCLQALTALVFDRLSWVMKGGEVVVDRTVASKLREP